MDGLPRRPGRNRLTTIASKAHNPFCNWFPAPCLLKKGEGAADFLGIDVGSSLQHLDRIESLPRRGHHQFRVVTFLS
jgi:hypothetical protein